MTQLNEVIAQSTLRAFNAGAKHERERVTEVLRGHLAVCNYKAVTNSECDVCAWSADCVSILEGVTP